MRSSLFLVALVFLSIQGKTQQKDMLKRNPMEEFQKKQRLNKLPRQMRPHTTADTLPVFSRKIENHNWVMGEPLKGTYVGNNGKGSDVYKVKGYNMICMVPDKTFKSNMPVAGNDKWVNQFTTPDKLFEKEP